MKVKQQSKPGDWVKLKRSNQQLLISNIITAKTILHLSTITQFMKSKSFIRIQYLE